MRGYEYRAAKGVGEYTWEKKKDEGKRHIWTRVIKRNERRENMKIRQTDRQTKRI